MALYFQRGLDCEICEAYIATVNNDNDLRIKVAKECLGSVCSDLRDILYTQNIKATLLF